MALRVKEKILEYAEVGDGGLGGRVLIDFKAEIALVYGVLVGVVGGDQQLELGRDGEARGTMSRGSASAVE